MPDYAVLGPRGTFCEEAAYQYWTHQTTLVYAADITEVFLMVGEGRVKGGLVPLWNSQAGSIPATVSNLVKSPVYISGEIVLPVRHCLLGACSKDYNEVELVISQSMAFLQCERFLRTRMPGVRKEIVESTARAARMVKAETRPAAAIGPRRAAEVYDLQVLAEGLEDDQANCTTFVFITRESGGIKGAKTSVIFGLKDEPGALYRVLGAFANRGINLTRLESRPGVPLYRGYLFLVDIEGGIGNSLIEDTLDEVQGMVDYFKFLGSY